MSHQGRAAAVETTEVSLCGAGVAALLFTLYCGYLFAPRRNAVSNTHTTQRKFLPDIEYFSPARFVCWTGLNDLIFPILDLSLLLRVLSLYLELRGQAAIISFALRPAGVKLLKRSVKSSPTKADHRIPQPPHVSL